MGTILGAEIIGGIVAIIFGIFVKEIRKLFPDVVTGTVIFGMIAGYLLALAFGMVDFSSITNTTAIVAVPQFMHFRLSLYHLHVYHLPLFIL